MFGTRHDLKHLEKSVVRLEQQPVVTGKIMFYGHSFFTRWGGKTWGFRRADEDVRMKDGSLAVVNHGFGTSTSLDLVYNYDRLVKPWAPRVLVVNVFGNDPSRGYSAAEIINNIALLCDFATADFPDIKIFCLSVAPGPKRNGIEDYFTRTRDEFNPMLKDFCEKRENVTFIDQYNWDMFYANAEDKENRIVRKDIYADDLTHLNQAGYDLYKEYFKEFLDEYL